MGRKLLLALLFCMASAQVLDQELKIDGDSLAPAEKPIYEYPLNTPEAEEIRRQELEQLKRLFHPENTGKSGCPFAKISQSGSVLTALLEITLAAESAYFSVYGLLKSNDVAYVLTYYSILVFVLYRAVFAGKTKGECVGQVIRKEENSDFGMCKLMVDAEVARMVTGAREFHKESDRQTLHEKLSATTVQLQDLASSHCEFSHEIVDSHSLILHDLLSVTCRDSQS